MWWRKEPKGRIVGRTRDSLTVTVDGSRAVVGGEILVKGACRSSFTVFPADIEWEDGRAMTAEERAAIMTVLLRSARRRLHVIEVAGRY